jgi:superfamily II DNA/RNA helicase
LTTTFAQLGLAPELIAAMDAQGITEPFAIQTMTIADALDGRDVCGKAKTGSGKTLAFGLPLVSRVTKAEPKRPTALVLVPTRELAAQVAGVLTPLAEAVGVRVGVVYGGVPIERHIRQLKRGVDILIATPGRLIDLGDRGEVSVSDVGILVLDEADRMADMGFMPQVEWVLRRAENRKQTLLFSATLDGDVDHLVKRYMRDPARHAVTEDQPTVEAMEHRFLFVHQLDKPKLAAAIARQHYKTLFFVRTKRGADRLAQQLKREGVKAEAIHGDLRQKERERGLADFGSGKLPALVATDVAARGLHVEDIDVVVHFDPPEDHKAYLHRSGRTARAGKRGVAVTLVLWDQQIEVERIQKRLGLSQPVVEMFSNDPRLGRLAEWNPADEGATV